MIKMLHLADLITELNGTSPYAMPLYSQTNAPPRLLRNYVYLLFYAILPWASLCTCKSLGSIGIHALWVILRFYGWQGCTMEEEEQFDGAGA
jgi:hypothetical protein